MPQRSTLRREDAADDYYHDKFNRGGHTSANDLQNLEKQYADSPDTDDTDEINNYANDPANSSKNIDKTREKESSSNSSAWQQNYTGKNSDNKITGKGMSKKKKWGIGGGLTIGISGLLVAAFMAILPMKIEAFIQNISKKVDAVPEYAVKQRANYLVTHAIAVRMFQMSNPGHDLVFCKSGTVGCSLTRTYTTNFIEKKYDLKMTKDGHKISITPNGRTQLGGKATSWTIEIPDSPNPADSIKKIENNKEMKQHIRSYVSEKIDKKGFGGTIKRYLARKILMRKYGVTKWRGFEKTQKKLSDLKTTIKSKMIKNTIGRISQRMGLYFGCINGGSTETCAKTINEIHGDSPNGDAAKQKYLGEGEPSGDETEKALSKFFSKQIIKSAGGVAGLVVLGDMLFTALSGVDNGSLDIVAQDMVANVDTGYAFGDDTGIVTNAEKVMAGDGNMAVLGQLSQTLDGATNSPLMRVDNGITSPQFAALTGGASHSMSCNSSFENKPQPIPKGQLVCNNQKFVRGYSKMLHDIPGLGAIFTFADYYAHSAPGKAIHKIITTVGKVTGWIIEHTPGVSALMKKIGAMFSGVLKAFMSFIFDPPPAGVGAGGGNNYVALRGALTNSSNQTMVQGVDDQGKAMGGAGTVLSTSQVAAIQKQQMNDTATSHTALASLFSPYVEGSLTQQFILTVPTQPSSMLASLLSLPSSIFASLAPQNAYAAVNSATLANPMGLIQYGYAKNSPVFKANPDKYTQAYCDKSAAAREASLTMPDQMDHKYAVPVYTKSDPCALEKMAVGTLLTSNGVDGNEYSLQDPVTDSSSYPGSGDGSSTPSSPNYGSAKDLAAEILKNKNITYGFTDVKTDLQLTSEGKPGTCNAPVDPQLLAVALDIAKDHKVVITALESNCTGHMKGSDHYKGKAIDFSMIDNTVAYKKIANVWPAIEQDAGGSYFLQRQCISSSSTPTPSGMKWIKGDTCSHIHMSLNSAGAP